MKRRYFLLSCCLLLSVFMLSCGNGPGAPGSSGSEDTGVMVDALIVPSTANVDAFQDVCDPGPPPTLETFTDHTATVTFTARLLNPNATFVPANLHIERYTIEYRRKNDSVGAPPIETYVGNQRIDIVPPVAGPGTITTVTTTLMFVDLRRKDKYANDMLTGSFSYVLTYLNNYTAIYTFEGQNDFGQYFSFTGQADFSIGNFDNC